MFYICKMIAKFYFAFMSYLCKCNKFVNMKHISSIHFIVVWHQLILNYLLYLSINDNFDEKIMHKFIIKQKTTDHYLYIWKIIIKLRTVILWIIIMCINVLNNFWIWNDTSRDICKIGIFDKFISNAGHTTLYSLIFNQKVYTL